MASVENPIADAFAVKPTTSHTNPIHLSRTTSLGFPVALPRKDQHRLLHSDGMLEIVEFSSLRVGLPDSSRADNTQVYELPATEVSVNKPLLKVVNNSDNNKCATFTSQASDVSIASDAAPGDLEALVNLGLSFGTTDNQGSPTLRASVLLDLDSEVDAMVSERIDREAIPQFNRWMRNIQKRRMTVNGPMDKSEKSYVDGLDPPNKRRHQKSSSESSSGFVTAVKSASISMASFSIAPPSKRTGVSSRRNKTEISSRASNTGRQSEDTSFVARSAVVDQGVTNRLLQRRLVLEELIATEENYIADVKFLQNVYVNLMGSIPSLTPHLRKSIHLNLNEIINLHEQLLGDLHRIVPHSEYTQADCIAERKLAPQPHGHNRWRSLDAVSENVSGAAWLQKIPGMTTEPSIAARVAKAFGKRINRFFVYEEYGAKYEIMLKDVTSTHRAQPQWNTFEAGLEALATTLASLNTQNSVSRKALTIGDLLVKPLQRVCKYPLLFGELLKHTPVCDCPDSHMEIDNVLIRLREATSAINRATDDPRMKAAIEKSWILQDRLFFPGMSKARSRTSIRGLGHIDLCGVLYASWQTKECVDGQYLISLLYRDFLLLASSIKNEQTYAVQACLGLSELRIEELDNGRGLQCHTAPFSWKLVFENNHQLFELTMSACSSNEENQWRKNLAYHISKASFDNGEEASIGTLALEIKPMGTVFGKPGTIARRMSIHRATTIGQMTGLCQVLIKNTTAAREMGHSAASAAINRSQSLLTTKRIPVLAPFRGERIRLEGLLADVWTRDLLPFPGMVGRSRGDVRTSASSIMRKLSVASIASNFSKRSSSLASIHRAADDEITVGSTSMKPNIIRNEHITSEAASIVDIERVDQLMNKGGNENTQRIIEQIASTLNDKKGYSQGTIRRIATLRPGTSFTLDGRRIITPPLRTSSANNMGQNRTASILTTASAKTDDGPLTEDGKENSPTTSTAQDLSLHKQKHVKWSKNKVRKSHGLRNLFR